jgi:uncharacterized protein YjbJ (UPF0337 family)
MFSNDQELLHDLMRCTPTTPKDGLTMDSEHIKGAADKAKGAIEDTAGKITGDEKLQAEGKMDKVKGAAHNAVGEVKDAVRDATKSD